MMDDWHMSSLRTWIILVDCNNFFASCEKLFRPDWKHRPVVVLSNNDGCIIARSAEVKKLGTVPMGAPYYQVRDEIRKHGILIRSLNHVLYADVSKRVMETLRSFGWEVEVYSVDEAFLHARVSEDQLERLGREIRNRVLKWVGIPVSVGIAPTKTLAKIANEAAKKQSGYEGVCNLVREEDRTDIMRLLPIEDVWGIGRRLAPKLRSLGVTSAMKLCNAPAEVIRRKFGVTVERVMRELQGLPCYEDQGLDFVSRKQIMCSRSFGIKVKKYQDLKEATCRYIEQAGQELRTEGKACATMSVFVRRGKAGCDFYEQHHDCRTGTFLNPTSDTRKLIKLGMELLQQLWSDEWTYTKSGVLLSDFSDPDYSQLSFDPDADDERSRSVMATLDKLKASGHYVHFAAQGFKRPWLAKKNLMSPCYTTKWSDLLRAGDSLK